jgi:hypothetical protein
MDSTDVVASAAQLYWCVLLKVLVLYLWRGRDRFMQVTAIRRVISTDFPYNLFWELQNWSLLEVTVF